MAAPGNAALLSQDARLRLSRSEWVQAAMLGLVVAVLYHGVVSRLLLQYYQDTTYSHGFLLLIVAAIALRRAQPQLVQAAARPSWQGAPVILFALMLFLLGIFGSELFLQRVSFVLLLMGLVVLFRGWPSIRATAFVWIVLVLAVPLPSIILSRITLPLQLAASGLAGTLLNWFGVPVLIDGNIIRLPTAAVDVAEACSGLRSVLSLISLAVVYGYFAKENFPGLVVLTAAAIPIAVFANACRIAQTAALLSRYDAQVALGWAHLLSGVAVFVLSFIIFVSIHRLMKSLRRLGARESA